MQVITGVKSEQVIFWGGKYLPKKEMARQLGVLTDKEILANIFAKKEKDKGKTLS